MNMELTGLRRLAWAATAFALVVIVFGAFVRLSNAGLSCPDWPTCYGKLAWPTQVHEIAHVDAAFPQRPFALAAWAWIRRRELGRLANVPWFAAGFIFFQA